MKALVLNKSKTLGPHPQDYPDDEILLVFDREFTYGQSFYLALTPEAKERILHVSQKPQIYAPPQLLNHSHDVMFLP